MHGKSGSGLTRRTTLNADASLTFIDSRDARSAISWIDAEFGKSVFERSRHRELGMRRSAEDYQGRAFVQPAVGRG